MNIPVALFLPIISIALFFAVIAKDTLYRPHYDLPQVIHFVRNLNVVEVADLLDPNEEWALRTLNSPEEFRKLQRERIRLAFEYLRRLGHNAEALQSWATDLRKELHGKAPEEFTIQAVSQHRTARTRDFNGLQTPGARSFGRVVSNAEVILEPFGASSRSRNGLGGDQ